MYQHILVPVDGSNTSNVALQQALTLAKEQHATVHLLNIYDPLKRSAEGGMIDLTASMRAVSETIVGEAAKAASDAGVEATTAAVNSDNRRISVVIVEEAVAGGVDLIIMGTHGRHGFEHLLLGSVAEGVVRRALAPVLLIRAR